MEQSVKEEPVPSGKKCTSCEEFKSLEQFSHHKRHKDGLASHCKSCISKKDKETRGTDRRKESHKKANRNYMYKRRYGIDLLEYSKMLDIQEGKCSICGRTDPGSIQHKHLYVDHDHRTGNIRGLLCFRCNSGLGYFKDDPKLFIKAFMYLNDPSSLLPRDPLLEEELVQMYGGCYD